MTIKPAYYNEIDPWAAQLLLNLIAAGHIAPGDVDTRSILDVKPDDIRHYTQHHFFAGAGVWSAALRKAGWPDDRRVWTASCPCQPFSAAGEGNGFTDERHLWPHLYHLITQLRPKRIYGEQVASKAVDPWIDLVHADLEAMGYAFGGVAFPSAGVGAPHIRDRTYWMADAMRAGWPEGWPGSGFGQIARGGEPIGLGNPNHTRPQGHTGHGGAAGWSGQARPIAQTSISSGMADSHSDRREQGREIRPVCEKSNSEYGGAVSRLADTIGQRHDRGRTTGATSSEECGRLAIAGHSVAIATQHPGPTSGLWRAADWLLCRDGKWRPVEPGTFPLAHGAPARVGRLRAYGNAINLEAACEFIRATMDY